MKILIWIGCIIASLIVNVVINVILSPFGIRLGYGLRGLLVAATTFLARYLCLKFEIGKIKTKAEKEGTSEIELVKREIPSSLRCLCEEHRGNEVALESLLDDCVKQGMINKGEAVLLLEEYLDN